MGLHVQFGHTPTRLKPAPPRYSDGIRVFFLPQRLLDETQQCWLSAPLRLLPGRIDKTAQRSVAGCREARTPYLCRPSKHPNASGPGP
jgi:hypothetical protein